MLNYIFSNIEKFIKEDEEYHPDCYFTIYAYVKFTRGDFLYDYHDDWFTKTIVLFRVFYGIGDLTRDIDIFQKIKLEIKEEFEANPYNLIFNTKPFKLKVIHRNEWPYTLGRIIENGRLEMPERLERIRRLARFTRREEERKELEREELEREEVEREEEKIINTSKSFKSDECVICLTEPPNVLFCNCGHIAIGAECSRTGESLKKMSNM